MSQNNNFTCHIIDFAYQFCKERKKLSGVASIIQQPVNAGSRRTGVKTAMPGVDYRSHQKRVIVL